MALRALFLLFALGVGLPAWASGFELLPLTTRNLSPLARGYGYGLPSLGAANVLSPGAGRVQSGDCLAALGSLWLAASVRRA